MKKSKPSRKESPRGRGPRAGETHSPATAVPLDRSRGRALYLAFTALSVVVGGAVYSIARGESTESSTFTDLGSSSASTRDSAIKSLADSTAVSLGTLQTGLESESSALVKAGIAEVIVKREPTASQVSTLSSSLSAADISTRLEVARLLGRTRPSTARLALTSCVESRTEHPDVRAAAAVSLGRAGSDAYSALLALSAATDLPVVVRGAVLRGLALTGTSGIKAVGAIATDDDAPQDRRNAAIAALGQSDAESEGVLVDLAESSSVAIRARAIEALVARSAKTSGAADALKDRLADTAAAIRRAAVEALVSLEGASSKKTEMLDLLEDSEESVVLATIQALGRAFEGGDKTVANELAGLVDHDHFVVRYHAALALGRLKDTRGLSAMEDHRDDESDDEKEAADDAASQIKANTK
jgi:HEAT repeat protein